MSVSSVGSAAALPVSLPSSGATGDAATATGTGTATPAGEHAPGATSPAPKAPTVKEAAVAAAHKQAAKPTPLPPLKGLTVVEIRAMLGVALPSGTTGQQPTPASAQSLAARYAGPG